MTTKTATFSLTELEPIMKHSEQSKDRKIPYAQILGREGENADPHLWLVGDNGIYLMSNGSPGLRKKEGEDANVVAYAHEANPEKMDGDDVWYAKRDIFGADDGVEEVPIDFIRTIQKSHPHVTTLKVKFAAGQMTFELC